MSKAQALGAQRGNANMPQTCIKSQQSGSTLRTDTFKQLEFHNNEQDTNPEGSEYQLDQLQVGRDAFFSMLKQSLAEQPELPEPVDEAAGLIN
jgi:hypothetical protein